MTRTNGSFMYRLGNFVVNNSEDYKNQNIFEKFIRITKEITTLGTPLIQLDPSEYPKGNYSGVEIE